LAVVEFWEKPGCAGNARQKTVLAASGHTVIPHNLLAETWTSDKLLRFFSNKPVSAWFNRNAVRIKCGALRPDTLSEAAALALLLADPLLIRRPLMRVGTDYVCGFDAAEVSAWIGLIKSGATIDESCQKSTSTCVA
jgi:nitrogenase-associated protein